VKTHRVFAIESISIEVDGDIEQ